MATDTLLRGAVAGDFPGFYGGSIFGSYPVPLDEATARASVLGASRLAFSETARRRGHAQRGCVPRCVATHGASDEIDLDLSGYAGTLTALGATSFTKVGIGGLDPNGASKGFDLDAASITAVPEPPTGVVTWMSRRQRRAT